MRLTVALLLAATVAAAAFGAGRTEPSLGAVAGGARPPVAALAPDSVGAAAAGARGTGQGPGDGGPDR